MIDTYYSERKDRYIAYKKLIQKIPNVFTILMSEIFKQNESKNVFYIQNNLKKIDI